ncbi:MAG: hypothetical protein JRE01_06275 [Deltaproteobacteria bacterium]|nr:hypothetical protein [Deltaproteobacteria bacterium]
MICINNLARPGTGHAAGPRLEIHRLLDDAFRNRNSNCFHFYRTGRECQTRTGPGVRSNGTMK